MSSTTKLKPPAGWTDVTDRGTGFALIGAPLPQLRQRIAYHESGHVIGCLVGGIPIISCSITTHPPRLLRGHFRGSTEIMVTMALCGPAAERCYVGPICDSSDQTDIAMARRYLARQLHPVQIGAALARLENAADSLVKTPWARDRIQLISAALLKYGALSGDEIGIMIAADA
jgi:hypothetical protein